MMKIRLVFVGRVKEKYYNDAIEEYRKRLSAFAEVTVREVKEEVCTGNSAEVLKALSIEGERIAAELKGKVVCLAIEGKKMSSEKLSETIGNYRDRGDEVTFVVGGSNGIDGKIKAKADMLVSFSDMTFPHSLARVMLFEQLYRAF